MGTFRNDVRIAIRMLTKNPGFTVIAVITLALGIAVNATMFSMVSAFLLHRPPGREPKRVAVVSSVDPAGAFHADAHAVSPPNYIAWKAANHVFTDMAAADEFRSVSLTADRQSEAMTAALVTANYFDIFGVTPQLGRTFRAGEDQAGQDHVVILSQDLWQRRFNSDASMLGRTIRINRETYTVIGLMPESFRLMGYPSQLWLPLTFSATDQAAAARKDRELRVYGRLKPSVTIEQASAEMASLAQHAEQDFPDAEKGWGAVARTLPDFLIYDFGIRSGLAVLMTTVGFVLMIACANVAGLMLARAAARKKELAIRRALGAGRLRVIRQLLTEGLVIASLGGSAGLLLTYWGINYLRTAMAFNESVATVHIELDWTVLVFAVAVSLLCAVLCSLAPALSASRKDINTNLKDESRAASAGRSHSRLRAVMVTGEIAMALFLLVGTGLLIRGLFFIEHQNLGFVPDHLLTAGLNLDSAHYKDDSSQALFVHELISRLERVPGAEVVAAASELPATGPASVPVRLKSDANLATNAERNALDVLVTPEYFRATGTPLLRGRTFAEADNPTTPRVVVVNQEFVNRYLAGQEPLGAQIRVDAAGMPPGWSEIVGVVGNVKSFSESTRYDPEVYEALYQRPTSWFSVMIRAASDPNVLASDLRNTVAQMDGELPLLHVMSMPAIVEQQRYGNPLFLRLLSGFALLALILAAIGIYGLVAYSVGQRTHEIGIRMALGAKNEDVLHMVLRQGLKMAAIGGVVGIAMALPLPKVFSSIFYDANVAVGTSWIYVVVPIAILAVAIAATYIPARRASRIDPMSALRQE